MSQTVTLQPGLRALMMFDTLPAGCVTQLVTDDYSMPHVRSGEFVVVDTKDRTPRAGEVYVIQWDGGRRTVCQASVSKLISEAAGGPRWSVGSIRVPGVRGWSDGWFKADYLQSKLVGAVIGVYQPAFEEPKRLVSKLQP